jgi:hypothetical protein
MIMSIFTHCGSVERIWPTLTIDPLQCRAMWALPSLHESSRCGPLETLKRLLVYYSAYGTAPIALSEQTHKRVPRWCALRIRFSGTRSDSVHLH